MAIDPFPACCEAATTKNHGCGHPEEKVDGKRIPPGRRIRSRNAPVLAERGDHGSNPEAADGHDGVESSVESAAWEMDWRRRSHKVNIVLTLGRGVTHRSPSWHRPRRASKRTQKRC